MTSQKLLMRRRRHDHTKPEVCKSYDRLLRKWQSLVDGTIVPSESQPLNEDRAVSAQQKMVEHRGEIPTAALAEIS
jgi:hypothetical protein